MRNAAQSLMDQADPGVLATDLAACADYRDGIADAARIRCPSTLLLGAEDRLTPVANGKQLAHAMARVPNGGRMEILRGCGHMIMAERPNDTIDMLRLI